MLAGITALVTLVWASGALAAGYDPATDPYSMANLTAQVGAAGLDDRVGRAARLAG